MITDKDMTIPPFQRVTCLISFAWMLWDINYGDQKAIIAFVGMMGGMCLVLECVIKNGWHK